MPQGISAVRPTNGLYLYLFSTNVNGSNSNQSLSILCYRQNVFKEVLGLGVYCNLKQSTSQRHTPPEVYWSAWWFCRKI